MKTSDYRTRTIFRQETFPNFNSTYRPIALDIGYSAVKGISPDMIWCFPSYAKKTEGSILNYADSDGTEIYYKDENGIYAVGALAQKMIDSNSSNDSLESLYGRNRYFSDVFRVISRTGIACSLINSPDTNAKPIIQTGLPTKYIRGDAPLLRESLTGRHTFQVKLGRSSWIPFDFTLDDKDIKIMKQPMGTLVSITTKENGLPTDDAQNIFKSNTLIFDAGFGTLDTNYIRGKSVDEGQTFDNLGMKHVLYNTAEAIHKNYGISIEVAAIQDILEKGYVKKLDYRTMKATAYPFDDILRAESYKVCMKALDKIKEIYNYFLDVDNLVITGGTGAAWSDFIREHLQGMEMLRIVSGNANCNMPYIFANVRGYYMYLINMLKNA